MFLPDSSVFKNIAKPDLEKYALTYRDNCVYLYYRDQNIAPKALLGAEFEQSPKNPVLWRADLSKIQGDVSLKWVPISLVENKPVAILELYPELSGLNEDHKDDDDERKTVSEENGAVRAGDAGIQAVASDAGRFEGTGGNREDSVASVSRVDASASEQESTDGRIDNNRVTEVPVVDAEPVSSAPTASQKSGLIELSVNDMAHAIAVGNIEDNGGWDVVTNDESLRERLQDSLDVLIQARAQKINDALNERGWMFGDNRAHTNSNIIPRVTIVPHGTPSMSRGNMVQWGYQINIFSNENNAWSESAIIMDDMAQNAHDFANETLIAGVFDLIAKAQNNAGLMDDDTTGSVAEDVSPAQDTESIASYYPRTTAVILEDYVQQNLEEQHQQVVLQAKANTLLNFRDGDVKSAILDALLDAMDDEANLSKGIRDTVAEILRDPVKINRFQESVIPAIFEKHHIENTESTDNSENAKLEKVSEVSASGDTENDSTMDAPQLEAIRAILFEGIREGDTMGELTTRLREENLNAIMSSEQVNQYFNMPLVSGASVIVGEDAGPFYTALIQLQVEGLGDVRIAVPESDAQNYRQSEMNRHREQAVRAYRENPDLAVEIPAPVTPADISDDEAFLIFSPVEYNRSEDGAYFWNMEDGWTTPEGATRFTESDQNKVDLPNVADPDVRWMSYVEAQALVNMERVSFARDEELPSKDFVQSVPQEPRKPSLDEGLLSLLSEATLIRDKSHPEWSGDAVLNVEALLKNTAFRHPDQADFYVSELLGDNLTYYSEASSLPVFSLQRYANILMEAAERVRNPQLGDLVRFQPEGNSEPFSGRVIAIKDGTGGDVSYQLRAEVGPNKEAEGRFYASWGSFSGIYLEEACGYDRDKPDHAYEGEPVLRGDYVQIATRDGGFMEGVSLGYEDFHGIDALRVWPIYRWPEGQPDMASRSDAMVMFHPEVIAHVMNAVESMSLLDTIDPHTEAYKRSMGMDTVRDEAIYALLTEIEKARGVDTRPLPPHDPNNGKNSVVPSDAEEASSSDAQKSVPVQADMNMMLVDGENIPTQRFLEERFGDTDASLGVQYRDADTDELVPADEVNTYAGDVIRVSENGEPADSTYYARYVQNALPKETVQVLRFSAQKNPDCGVVHEGWHTGPHAFALVEHRYLVDPWAKLAGGFRKQAVFDLQDAEEAERIAQTYGNPQFWEELVENNADEDQQINTAWDRAGTEHLFGNVNNTQTPEPLSATLDDADDILFDAPESVDASTAEEQKPDQENEAVNGHDSGLMDLLYRDNGVSISDIVNHPDFEKMVFHGDGATSYVVPPDFAEKAYVGEKTRARNNLAAVRLLKALDLAAPTLEPGQLANELQDVLAKFAGWGGLPKMFREEDGNFREGWEVLGLSLESLLDHTELREARRTTLDAHYTDVAVIEAMWTGLRQAGMPTKQMVLEPSTGSGLFIGAAPQIVQEESRFMGCELDGITARIAQRLYPKAQIRHSRFELFPLIRNNDDPSNNDSGFDLVIGNPPFGEQTVFDPANPDISDSAPNIHMYFFEKSLRELRPGGVMSMVVSRYLLDAQSKPYEDWRKKMAINADLSVAVRLPSNTFTKNAGTQVVTDILTFRKRNVPLAESIEDLADHDYPDWVFATDHMAETQDGKAVSGNRYYQTHPENILGESKLIRGMHTENEPAVIANRSRDELAMDIVDRISTADITFNREPSIQLTAQENMSGEDLRWMEFAVVEMRSHRDNSWFVVNMDGEERLAIRDESSLEGYAWVRTRDDKDAAPAENDEDDSEESQNESDKGFRPSEIKRIIGMCHIRDALRDLMQQQVLPTAKDHEIEEARSRLNVLYDAFQKKHGYLHRRVNQRLFRSDFSYGALQALEKNYVKAITAPVAKKTGQPKRPESAEKSDVFFKRTQFPVIEPDKASDPLDALRLSLSQKGGIDKTYMVHLLRDHSIFQDIEPQNRWSVVREALGDVILLDPYTSDYNVRELVLSGDVVTKLETARKAMSFIDVEDSDEKKRIYSADEWQRSMEALEKVQPERIGYYDIGFRFGTPWIPHKVMRAFIDEKFGPQVTFSYIAAAGTWFVNGASTSNNDTRWSAGSNDVTSLRVLKTVLNDQPELIRKKDKDGNYRVDETASALLKARCGELKEEWSSWLENQPELRDDIEENYNLIFNREVLPQFDGSHLELIGASDAITFRPHQKNAVWRGLQGQNMLMDHAVGAGKTFVEVALVMESRRLGLCRKPMIVVPNHLVAQWRDAFLTLYPSANVLALEKDDMSKSGRQDFLARAAYGDQDVIIVPHSTFGKIPPAPEDEIRYMENEIEIFEETLAAYKEANDKRSVKRLERKIDSFKAKIEKRMESLQDDGDSSFFHMGNIGVDFLGVDEVQEFKNLPFTTNMKNVSGMGNPAGSLKATDLFIKCKGIQSRRPNGGGVTFLTGTPLSNTLAEMYIWQRYLDEESLEEKGLRTFDAWKDTFASVIREYGFTVTGDYKERTYLGKFENWPDLLRMLDKFKDSVTISDVREMLREAGMDDMPIPRIDGGAPEIVRVEPTTIQQQLIGLEIGEKPDGTPIYNPGSILHRLDNLSGKPEKGKDNILSLSSELAKVSLSALAWYKKDNGAGDENGLKLAAAKDSILKSYHDWDADKGTQLVFLDSSTPANANGKVSAADQKVLNAVELVNDYETVMESEGVVSDDLVAAYDDAVELLDTFSPTELESIIESANTAGWSAYVNLREMLIESGIPAHEIAFIHDYDGEKKEELFGKVRSGVVRVLMGSSQKMGAGVNVQDLVVAAHHLDAPYRPLDLEQRNGRVLRQGNKLQEKYGDKFSMRICYYVTEGASDPGRWQILEFKKRFIDQTRISSNAAKGLRQLEDPSAQALDPAKVKAEASGSKVLMDRVEVGDILKKNEQMLKAKLAAADDVKRMIAYNSGRLTELKKDSRVIESVMPQIKAYMEKIEVAEAEEFKAAKIRHEAAKEARKQARKEERARKKLSQVSLTDEEDFSSTEEKTDEQVVDSGEDQSKGFITLEAINPVTMKMERMENLTYRELGVLIEKTAIAYVEKASSYLSSKNVEVNEDRAKNLIGETLVKIRDESDNVIASLNISGLRSRMRFVAFSISAHIENSAGCFDYSDDVKNFELTAENIMSVKVALDNDRKKGQLDLSSLGDNKNLIYASGSGRRLLAWMNGIEFKQRIIHGDIQKYQEQLSAAEKEMERQSGSYNSDAENVLKYVQDVYKTLENALRCGIRKYEMIDHRLEMLSKAIEDEIKSDLARKESLRAMGKPLDEDNKAPEKTDEKRTSNLEVFSFKRDLLLSIRDDLEAWAAHRESAIRDLRMGCLPTQDFDEVCYAGEEDKHEIGKHQDMDQAEMVG